MTSSKHVQHIVNKVEVESFRIIEKTLQRKCPFIQRSIR